jgi:hypothetical protein
MLTTTTMTVAAKVLAHDPPVGLAEHGEFRAPLVAAGTDRRMGTRKDRTLPRPSPQVVSARRAASNRVPRTSW